jgi:hypothetical protein
MNRSWKLLNSGFILLTFTAVLIAGCENKSNPNDQSQSETESTLHQTTSSTIGNSPMVSIGTPNGEPTTAPDATIDHEAHVSANGPSTVDPNSKLPASVTSKSAPKPKVDAKDAYQQEKPTLMGLKLGTDKDLVLSRFGKAKNQFVMDEDAQAVTVYEYVDFSVGFNPQNELEFVDVHTADIDPGLRGLRLGQKSEDAIATLGKPDSNTTYVLSYKAHGTLLKLDIDPIVDTIQSIKLFANEE